MLNQQERLERIERLRARLGLLEQKEKTAERKRQTRRRVLWGTLVEEMMAADPAFARSMRQRAGRTLTRRIDREALGLRAKRHQQSDSGRT